MRLLHQLFRPPLIVFSYADAQPIFSYGAGELQYLRGVVPVGELVFQPCGIRRVFESANLDTPSPASINGRR
jgi:hypothetical protein